MKNSKKNATKKSTTTNTAPRLRLEPALFIVKTAAGNPRREGTWGHQSFSLIKKGITVEKFVEKGGRLRDLHWDINHGHVKLSKKAA